MCKSNINLRVQKNPNPAHIINKLFVLFKHPNLKIIIHIAPLVYFESYCFTFYICKPETCIKTYGSDLTKADDSIDNRFLVCIFALKKDLFSTLLCYF